METIWKVFSCFVALLFLELCNGLPLDFDRALPDGHTQLLTGLIAVLLTICGVVCLAGCLCCQRRNGFKEFRDSPVVISVASNLDHGHVNPIANGGEFTIFTPLSPPHQNNNVFLANQQVITRAEEDFKNGDIDVTSWFDSNEKDFPRTRLKYIKEFGKGWFGRVVEGTAQGLDEEDDAKWTPVIVRILEATASSRQRVLFLHDAKIYRCPKHPNLLELLGRSLESIPLLLLQEHLTQGDLKLYLRKQRPTREAFLAGELPLRWCHQLASAVKHLHDHNITHPDLAARNCQISQDLNLKLGDYGCSTSDYPDDYYHGTENVPVRWCAPECVLYTATTIQTKNVTTAGNIWSLGVCLWEIYECGERPYSNLSDDEVVSQVLGPPNVRLPKPSLSVLYTDYVYKLMQLCWSTHELRPSISQIDLMLLDLVQVHRNSGSSQEEPPVSIQDFDARWENFKPNDIVKEDNHIVQVIEPENDLANITVLNMSVPTKPDAKQLSASLHNLAGSFDNLLESGRTENSWANSETEDLSFTNAIRDLDSALAAENITSSSDSSPKIKFKLSKTKSKSKDLLIGQKSSSESETEDELWRKKIEKGVYTEKVRIKSRSVADLMVLTHIDYSESDSETPLTSLDYSNLRGLSQRGVPEKNPWGESSFKYLNPWSQDSRTNYRNVRYGPKQNLENSLTFGSEGNLLSVQDTFQQELKKLQEERRDSLLFVPDNKLLTSSPETKKVLEDLNSPANLEPQKQVFNVYNCVAISPKYSPIHKIIEYKNDTNYKEIVTNQNLAETQNKNLFEKHNNQKEIDLQQNLVDKINNYKEVGLQQNLVDCHDYREIGLEQNYVHKEVSVNQNLVDKHDHKEASLNRNLADKHNLKEAGLIHSQFEKHNRKEDSLNQNLADKHNLKEADLIHGQFEKCNRKEAGSHQNREPIPNYKENQSNSKERELHSFKKDPAFNTKAILSRKDFVLPDLVLNTIETGDKHIPKLSEIIESNMELMDYIVLKCDDSDYVRDKNKINRVKNNGGKTVDGICREKELIDDEGYDSKERLDTIEPHVNPQSDDLETQDEYREIADFSEETPMNDKSNRRDKPPIETIAPTSNDDNKLRSDDRRLSELRGARRPQSGRAIRKLNSESSKDSLCDVIESDEGVRSEGSNFESSECLDENFGQLHEDVLCEKLRKTEGLAARYPEDSEFGCEEPSRNFNEENLVCCVNNKLISEISTGLNLQEETSLPKQDAISPVNNQLSSPSTTEDLISSVDNRLTSPSTKKDLISSLNNRLIHESIPNEQTLTQDEEPFVSNREEQLLPSLVSEDNIISAVNSRLISEISSSVSNQEETEQTPAQDNKEDNFLPSRVLSPVEVPAESCSKIEENFFPRVVSEEAVNIRLISEFSSNQEETSSNEEHLFFSSNERLISEATTSLLNQEEISPKSKEDILVSSLNERLISEATTSVLNQEETPLKGKEESLVSSLNEKLISQATINPLNQEETSPKDKEENLISSLNNRLISEATTSLLNREETPLKGKKESLVSSLNEKLISQATINPLNQEKTSPKGKEESLVSSLNERLISEAPASLLNQEETSPRSKEESLVSSLNERSISKATTSPLNQEETSPKSKEENLISSLNERLKSEAIINPLNQEETLVPDNKEKRAFSSSDYSNPEEAVILDNTGGRLLSSSSSNYSNRKEQFAPSEENIISAVNNGLINSSFSNREETPAQKNGEGNCVLDREEVSADNENCVSGLNNDLFSELSPSNYLNQEETFLEAKERLDDKTKDCLFQERLDSSNLLQESVDSSNLLQENVNSLSLLQESVDSSNLLQESVDSSNLLQESVDSLSLLQESVDSSNLLQESVDSSNLLQESVDSSNLLQESVDSLSLLQENVDSSNLLQESVDSSNLLQESVDSSNLLQEDLDPSNLLQESSDSSKLFQERLNSSNLLQKSLNSSNLLREDLDDSSKLLQEQADSSNFPQEHNHSSNTQSRVDNLISQQSLIKDESPVTNTLIPGVSSNSSNQDVERIIACGSVEESSKSPNRGFGDATKILDFGSVEESADEVVEAVNSVILERINEDSPAIDNEDELESATKEMGIVSKPDVKDVCGKSSNYVNLCEEEIKGVSYKDDSCGELIDEIEGFCEKSHKDDLCEEGREEIKRVCEKSYQIDLCEEGREEIKGEKSYHEDLCEEEKGVCEKTHDDLSEEVKESPEKENFGMFLIEEPNACSSPFRSSLKKKIELGSNEEKQNDAKSEEDESNFANAAEDTGLNSTYVLSVESKQQQFLESKQQQDISEPERGKILRSELIFDQEISESNQQPGVALSGIFATRDFLRGEIEKYDAETQASVKFDLSLECTNSSYVKPSQENAVILGASDDYSIDYYSGLKTTNCEEKALKSNDPDMKYSLETWDNFLGRSFDEQRDFDGFSSNGEPQSMLFLENQEVKAEEKGVFLDEGAFLEARNVFLGTDFSSLQGCSGNEKFVGNEEKQTELSAFSNHLGVPLDGQKSEELFLSDDFPPPPTSLEMLALKGDDKEDLLSDDDDEALNTTFTVNNPNTTFEIDKGSSGDNVVDLSDINVEMEDSTEEKQGYDNPGYWENENSGGWFLHPQSVGEDLSGQMDVSEDDSYVGFSMDDEIMAAIRNELLTKLPQAQRASAEQIEDGDGEYETTDRNEVFVRYNCYNTPLSPIPEESYSELLNSGQSTPHCTINTDLGDDSDWSEPGIDPNSILDDDTHSPRVLESPHKGPHHRHTPSQDSCCSNDTLFNLEELQYTEKMLDNQEKVNQLEEVLATKRFNHKEKMMESQIRNAACEVPLKFPEDEENSAELKTPTNEDFKGLKEMKTEEKAVVQKQERLTFIVRQGSEERTSLENFETVDSSLPSSTDNTTTRLLTQMEVKKGEESRLPQGIVKNLDDFLGMDGNDVKLMNESNNLENKEKKNSEEISRECDVSKTGLVNEENDNQKLCSGGEEANQTIILDINKRIEEDIEESTNGKGGELEESRVNLEENLIEKVEAETSERNQNNEEVKKGGCCESEDNRTDNEEQKIRESEAFPVNESEEVREDENQEVSSEREFFLRIQPTMSMNISPNESMAFIQNEMSCDDLNTESSFTKQIIHDEECQIHKETTANEKPKASSEESQKNEIEFTTSKVINRVLEGCENNYLTKKGFVGCEENETDFIISEDLVKNVEGDTMLEKVAKECVQSKDAPVNIAKHAEVEEEDVNLERRKCVGENVNLDVKENITEERIKKVEGNLIEGKVRDVTESLSEEGRKCYEEKITETKGEGFVENVSEEIRKEVGNLTETQRKDFTENVTRERRKGDEEMLTEARRKDVIENVTRERRKGVEEMLTEVRRKDVIENVIEERGKENLIKEKTKEHLTKEILMGGKESEGIVPNPIENLCLQENNCFVSKETSDFINAERLNYATTVARSDFNATRIDGSPIRIQNESSEKEEIPEKKYDLLKSSMRIEVESRDCAFKPDDNSSSSETYLTVSDGYVVPPLNSPEDRPWKHIEASLTRCPPDIRNFDENRTLSSNSDDEDEIIEYDVGEGVAKKEDNFEGMAAVERIKEGKEGQNVAVEMKNEERFEGTTEEQNDGVVMIELSNERNAGEIRNELSEEGNALTALVEEGAARMMIEGICAETTNKTEIIETLTGKQDIREMEERRVEEIGRNKITRQPELGMISSESTESIKGEENIEETKTVQNAEGTKLIKEDCLEGYSGRISKIKRDQQDGKPEGREQLTPDELPKMITHQEEVNIQKQPEIPSIETPNDVYENIEGLKNRGRIGEFKNSEDSNSDDVYENIEEMNLKNSLASAVPDYVNAGAAERGIYANLDCAKGEAYEVSSSEVYADMEVYAENPRSDIYDCVNSETQARKMPQSDLIKLNPDYVNDIPTYVNDPKVKNSSQVAQYVNTQPEYENHTEIPIVYENMNYDVYIDLLNDEPEVEYDNIDGGASVADVYGPLTDIRFTGPGDSQMMTTSFSDSNDLGDEQDWDSGSDTRSSSSGEFIWKEGEHEASVKALHAAPQDAESQRSEVQREEEDSSSGSEEDCEGPEFVPSAWDKHLAPTKSALRSPEKTDGKKNRGVSFKKQKYHCVYEYPREPESPVVQNFDMWQDHPNNSIDWDVDRDTELFLPAASSDTEAFGEAGPTSSVTTQPQNHSNKQHRNLYQTSSVPDFIGSSIQDDDFYISSSAKPFDMFNTASSQFFPGRHCDWSELIKNNDNVTPDSGVEDITPGSLSDSSSDYIRPSKQILPLKTLAQIAINNSKTAQGGSNEIGGLRHTRNRLKLDLPPSPSAFTKSFSLEPVLDVVNRQVPTFTTFGKSRFVVQQVDTPTDEGNAKNVSFEALPYKPISPLYKPINVYSDDHDSHFFKNEEPPRGDLRFFKGDEINSLTTHIYKDDHDRAEKNRVEIVRGEASLLDSADEDSGIESCTLERKRVSSGIPLK